MYELVRELTRLPSIGERSALRLAYHLISLDPQKAKGLSRAIEKAVDNIHQCSNCFFLTEGEKCSVCDSPTRDQALICVVEKPMDLIAFERTGEYKGVYHVLHGLWAPLKGKGEDAMRLRELLNRVEATPVNEVILGLSSTVEGDATSLYISKLLAERGIPVSRLAQGLPRGGELEYADDFTMMRALQGRNRIS